MVRGGRSTRLTPGLGLLVLCAMAFTPLALAQDSVALFGSDRDDTLTGTAAPESIYARAGNDRIDGAGGDDELDGGPGADVLIGSDGTDAVSYSGPAPISITLDGQPNDGATGEGDNVATDVEDLFGGDGPDRLSGDGGSNTIDGGGDDDRIDGGPGRDALFGGDGDDTITSQDNQVDRIDCGAGSGDRADIDAQDATVGCERVARPTLTPGFRLSRFTPVAGRIRSMLLGGVPNGSQVVVACISGCRPLSPATRAIVRRRSVETSRGAATIKLPASPRVVGGSTIEIGVTGPDGARTRCVTFRFSQSFKVRRPRRACTSVARQP